MSVTIALGGLLIEALFGYPDRVLGAIGHPVIWIGRLIAQLDLMLNRPDRSQAYRRVAGILTLLVAILVAAVPSWAIERALLRWSLGLVATAVAASTLIAQRSLHQHVAAVAAALEQHGLEAGRAAVSRIVGRDPERLDAFAVARAAIESLAENFSDGIVAPAFWLMVGGLAGGAAYKAINTADSMIGHLTDRHAAFGHAAARLDDLVNLPASRLAAILIVAAAMITPGATASGAWQAVRHDAARHRSPNAGYPEAAMAGALGLALAGPRTYGGVLVEDALMGAGRREATAADIRAALRLYRRADALLIVLAGLLALIAWSFG
jgi:adenosylcobinamide-phosphate synthase